jgi:hypothetical protein
MTYPASSLKNYLEDSEANIPLKRKYLFEIEHRVTHQKFKQRTLTILKATVLMLKRGNSFPRN